MPPARKNLDHYRKKLIRAGNPVTCRQCGESVLPKVFENHVSQFHGFDPKLGCAWCRETFWSKSEKHANACHLLACFQEFILPPPLPPPSLPPLPAVLRVLILRHLFPEKDHFGVVPLPIHTLHEFVWPLLVWPIRIFRDDPLNLAAAYLRKFLRQRDTHEWYHVMVKAVAMERFIEAMDADGGQTRTLLFSCWCDGGPYEEARHRQHRHLIVVSPKGHFEKHVWAKVELSGHEKPHPYYPCKSLRRIETPMHLVNVLGYVSHRRSRCESEKTCGAHDKLHHFYLYKTLPADFRLPLVLLWCGGLQQLLDDRKFRNVSLARLIEKPVFRVGGQWKQKIKDFYGHERGLVVPVANGLMPTRDVVLDPVCTFYLLDGEKLYLEHSLGDALLDEALDPEHWMRKQALAGNCFYDVVEEQLWTMRPRDQATLSLLMPLVEQTRELKAEIAELKEQREVSERFHRAALDDVKGKMASVERQCEEKMGKMKRRHEEEIVKREDSSKKRMARMERLTDEKVMQMEKRHVKEINRIKDSTRKKMARMKKK